MFETTLHYGRHPDQVADLYFPEGDGPAPLVIFLHGGFWRAEADRTHVNVVAEDLAARGYAVANTEYRRVGAGGGWPATLTDVADATDALPELAERAAPGRIDVHRVVYMGHSAGGHLALWAAVRHRIPEGGPGRLEAPPRVAGVIALSPAADLVWANELGSGRGAVAEFLGGGLEEFPERYAAADPMLLGAAEVPVVVVHGDKDAGLPVEMARGYAEHVGAELVVPEGGSHFDLIDPHSAAWPLILDALTRITS